MADAISELMKHAVPEATLSKDGIYTRPRSFGVYDIGAGHGDTKRFRFGNHPIRAAELQAKYGQAKVLAVFLERRFAESVANIRNAKV